MTILSKGEKLLRESFNAILAASTSDWMPVLRPEKAHALHTCIRKPCLILLSMALILVKREMRQAAQGIAQWGKGSAVVQNATHLAAASSPSP